MLGRSRIDLVGVDGRCATLMGLPTLVNIVDCSAEPRQAGSGAYHAHAALAARAKARH